MLRVVAVNDKRQCVEGIPLERLNDGDIAWYWVDFDCPTDDEIRLLDEFFGFHPLAIEDCLHFLQRPKVDHYGDTHFFVLHSLNPETQEAEEVDFFLGPRGIVTFHLAASQEVEEVGRAIGRAVAQDGTDQTYVAYKLLDKLVDQYFPVLYKIEDQLNDLEALGERDADIQALTEQVYDIRADLLRIRRTVFPMRDLLYRVLNSNKIPGVNERLAYFTDIYDHLLKLTEMIESNREMTADLRDSYDSLRSNRMNSIMKRLTVMTTIFMPLTFIAGVYGMNFVHMPELEWHSGYFIVLGVMAGLGLGMYGWFKAKGWFD
ncbi:magnesium/cobalt transporter CorA [Cohnella suwonensis]|uniref:Magnesium transport protein CorA n=1 Tax=Cohnella suwonensis TaxID=696072 RepID=A0ABW0LXU3_9BACL